MKQNVFILFLLTVFIPVVLGQNSSASKLKVSDFEKMSFEFEVDKTSYVLFEPIFVTFKFTNKTDIGLTIYNPSFLSDSRVKVVYAGVAQNFDQLPRFGTPSVRIPAKVAPKWFSSKEEMFGSQYVINFFPQAGEYKLQFILKDWDGDNYLESNVVTLTIKEPVGPDRKAFDFISNNYYFFGQSSWILDGEKGQNLLEHFLKKHSDSVYAESVISSLGYVYFSRKEFDKAKIEFEKLRNSKHAVVSLDAIRMLVDTEQRILANQKVKM